MPLVTVIIPTFNRAHVLERAVRSVLDQTYRDFELIVVDDGSEDGTDALLSRYDGRLTAISQGNRGVSAARNKGIRAARGEFIAFLDSDDAWRPEKLARQMAAAPANDALFVSHTDETWIRNGVPISQKGHHRKEGGRFFERALERCLISPSSVMLSRGLLDRVGWFDEDLPAAEDYDLWLRITAFYGVHFVAEPLVVKYGGGSDQLSRIVPGIDRFRIRAILKILDDERLNESYRAAAIRELIRKCGIVANGCAKRGKPEEAGYYRELARKYDNDHR